MRQPVKPWIDSTAQVRAPEMRTILLLGGTDEARELAAAIIDRGGDLVVSLPEADGGETAGRVRRGGFGGIEEMTGYLQAEGIGVVVDATDPFAPLVSPTAKRAARAGRRRYLRLERPAWRRSAGDRWTDVRSLEKAAARIDTGARVLVVAGGGGLAPILRRRDLTLVVRAAEEAEIGPRHDVTVLPERAGSDIDTERDLLTRHDIDVVVAKNSGGASGTATLVAARERRIHVIMVRRPRGQPWANARTVDEMLARLRRDLPR